MITEADAVVGAPSFPKEAQMAKEWQVRVEGDQTGVPRWQWPVIGAVLFGLVLALVFLIAALSS